MKFGTNLKVKVFNMLHVCIICAIKTLRTKPSNPERLGKSYFNLCGWMCGEWRVERLKNVSRRTGPWIQNETAKVNIGCCFFLGVMWLYVGTYALFLNTREMPNLVSFSLYSCSERASLHLQGLKSVTPHHFSWFFFQLAGSENLFHFAMNERTKAFKKSAVHRLQPSNQKAHHLEW